MTVQVAPASGPPGSTFTVTGNGFSPGETVAITLSPSQLSPGLADGSGHFDQVETVPSLPAQTYTVAAKGGLSFVSVTSQFKVTHS